MDDEERTRLEAIHEEIWKASIAPGFNRSNELAKKRAIGPAPEGLLHFAPASAVANILPKRTLRVSRARSSNDPKELDHGIQLARQELDTAAHDRSEEIFRDELLASFGGRKTDGSEGHHIDPHICCFTEADNANLVAQWAMYGRDGSGFALNFKAKALENKTDTSLGKISYDEEEQSAYLRDLLTLARGTCSQAYDYANERYGGGWGEQSFRLAARAFGGVVALHAATMKAPEFRAEREWRLLHPGMGSVSGVEAKGPILRTHFDVAFEPDDLLSIIVGPVHADVNRPVIWRLLKEGGYSATIETGKVALRTLGV